MVAKAIREEHPRARPLHMTMEPVVAGLPGVGTLAIKAGGVPRIRPTSTACCSTRVSSCSSFPRVARARRSRSRSATGCAGSVVVSSWRWRCARRSRSCRSRSSAPRSTARACADQPRTPPHQASAGSAHLAVPLPAKFKLRFLEPVATDELGDRPWEDRSLVQRLGQDIRALIQENLLEMVAARRSVWLG